MSNIETRLLNVSELRASKRGEEPVIEGYASVFNSRSENLGGFYEYIMPGAFDRALREEHDVRALIDHESSKVLGRTKAGTLELSVDDKGLKVRVTPPDTSYARDLMESMRRGDITQMSFGFRLIRDDWATEDAMPVRRVYDLELLDVSVVTYPAYPATEVALRSLDEWKSKQEAPAPVEEAPAEADESWRLDLFEKEQKLQGE